jgi:hypothetical protein
MNNLGNVTDKVTFVSRTLNTYASKFFKITRRNTFRNPAGNHFIPIFTLQASSYPADGTVSNTELPVMYVCETTTA